MSDLREDRTEKNSRRWWGDVHQTERQPQTTR